MQESLRVVRLEVFAVRIGARKSTTSCLGQLREDFVAWRTTSQEV
jgi:hypothetical protein